ncbi:MAG: hypothetical protein Q9218_007985, partial [Villophora microphyllina]
MALILGLVGLGALVAAAPLQGRSHPVLVGPCGHQHVEHVNNAVSIATVHCPTHTSEANSEFPIYTRRPIIPVMSNIPRAYEGEVAPSHQLGPSDFGLSPEEAELVSHPPPSSYFGPDVKYSHPPPHPPAGEHHDPDVKFPGFGAHKHGPNVKPHLPSHGPGAKFSGFGKHHGPDVRPTLSAHQPFGKHHSRDVERLAPPFHHHSATMEFTSTSTIHPSWVREKRGLRHTTVHPTPSSTMTAGEGEGDFDLHDPRGPFGPFWGGPGPVCFSPGCLEPSAFEHHTTRTPTLTGQAYTKPAHLSMTLPRRAAATYGPYAPDPTTTELVTSTITAATVTDPSSSTTTVTVTPPPTTTTSTILITPTPTTSTILVPDSSSTSFDLFSQRPSSRSFDLFSQRSSSRSFDLFSQSPAPTAHIIQPQPTHDTITIIKEHTLTTSASALAYTSKIPCSHDQENGDLTGCNPDRYANAVGVWDKQHNAAPTQPPVARTGHRSAEDTHIAAREDDESAEDVHIGAPAAREESSAENAHIGAPPAAREEGSPAENAHVGASTSRISCPLDLCPEYWGGPTIPPRYAQPTPAPSSNSAEDTHIAAREDDESAENTHIGAPPAAREELSAENAHINAPKAVDAENAHVHLSNRGLDPEDPADPDDDDAADTVPNPPSHLLPPNLWPPY